MRSLFTILCVIVIHSTGFCQEQTADSSQIEKTTSDTTKRSLLRRVYKYFQESNEVKEEKRFDFSIIGGPHFSSDTKLGLGLVASGLYRIDRNDRSISPSNVSLYGDVTTTGFYLLGIRGNTIFPHEKYRLDANIYFFSFPSKYWGVGYANGSQQDHFTTYKRKETQIKLDFLRKIAPKTYVGATTIFRNVNAKDVKDPEFLKGDPLKISTYGIGFMILYDSRDFIPNPYKGTYAKMEQIFFPHFNTHSFRRTELTFRHYNKLWKGAILAYDLQGIFNYGNTPWSMVAFMGGSYQMRGYYEGQYRDNDMVQTQIEIRQKIYNRHGIAFWGGAGNVFPDFKKYKWSETLPTYGLGYRWEFKNRVNVRLDYGFGKGQSAFYFSINEAF